MSVRRQKQSRRAEVLQCTHLNALKAVRHHLRPPHLASSFSLVRATILRRTRLSRLVIAAQIAIAQAHSAVLAGLSQMSPRGKSFTRRSGKCDGRLKMLDLLALTAIPATDRVAPAAAPCSHNTPDAMARHLRFLWPPLAHGPAAISPGLQFWLHPV
jgi:hypothetical protein